MKHKPILLGTALSVIMLLSISGLAFAANATNTSPNSANGDVEVRTDLAPGGKTANQLEFWQADEFESWMEQERAYYQQLADNGDKSFWYKNADEEYVCREWTQADVDALYATWKEQLALIRQGYQFTKAFETADGGSLVGGFLPEE